MLISSNELKKSYKILATILVAGIGIYLASAIYESSGMEFIIRVALVAPPLAVSISCFLTSKNYDHSKVFGKSYVLLGIGYLVMFAGELVFFSYEYYLHLPSYSALGDTLIFLSYPFMMAHIVLNVRYFVEKLELFQKFLLVGIPVIILLVYYVVLMGDFQDNSFGFYYSLLFVSASSILLGLAVVAFTMFRQTVMVSAWFVLLVGIMIGTVGDILYNYAFTLGVYSFGDFSNVLWIISPMIMIYALYQHQKSI